jgi:hypothetical protein
MNTIKEEHDDSGSDTAYFNGDDDEEEGWNDRDEFDSEEEKNILDRFEKLNNLEDEDH